MTRARIRRRQLAVIVLVACAITPVFNVLTSEASLRSAIQGLLDAVLITLLVGGYLMFVRDGRARMWFQRLGFWADLTLSSAIVLVLFLTGRAAGQVATSLEPGGFLMSFTDRHLIYALPFFAVLAVTIQFILQMNRMIGANVLGYFVAGIYHRLLLTGSAEPHARVLGATVARGRGAARLSTPTRAGTMPAKGDSHARRNGHRLSESRPAAERSRSVPARAEARRSRRAARLSVDLGRRAPFTDYTMCPDVLQKIQQYGTDTVIDYFMNLQVWGTPEQCYGKILDINRRSGNSHYVGVFSYAGMPYEEAEDNLRLFAREVMPELQKLEPQVAAERTERVAVPIEPPVNVGLLGS